MFIEKTENKINLNFMGIKFSASIEERNIFKKLIYKVLKTPRVVFYWKEEFSQYMSQNDMDAKVENLKRGLDEVSCEYIDNFMRLIPYWDRRKINVWTKYDKELDRKNKKFIKTFKQPFEKILKINPFFFSNGYALFDLPKKNYDSIDGKIIIDGGGLNGDTAIVFHKYFPNSPIHVYEPLVNNVKIINSFLEIDNCGGKIIPIQKGLSNEEGVCKISFCDNENEAQLVTIDKTYAGCKDKIGLIKLDTEGFETKILKGGIEVIKRDKPVLCVAIYHTPQDFFELKDELEKLNLGYKFMIRRSEMVLPQADLVLIGYVP